MSFTDGISVGNYFNFTDGYSGGIVFFFITDRNGDGIIITDAHDSDGINPSKIPSVRILPTGFVPYTDGMYPSAKLYNGVVLVNEAKTSYDM